MRNNMGWLSEYFFLASFQKLLIALNFLWHDSTCAKPSDPFFSANVELRHIEIEMKVLKSSD